MLPLATTRAAQPAGTGQRLLPMPRCRADDLVAYQGVGKGVPAFLFGTIADYTVAWWPMVRYEEGGGAGLHSPHPMIAKTKKSESTRTFALDCRCLGRL